MEKHILTVDVEDNFTREELKNGRDWDRYEGQVVTNTKIILDLLATYNSCATFFIVGTVAERHPEIVEQIIKKGHEVASHSYWHKPLSKMSTDEVEEDIRRSSHLLSELAGKQIAGFRAMAYSIPEDEGWFYSLLKTYGFTYDSSKKRPASGRDETIQDIGIQQIYPSAVSFFGKQIVFSGGSYLRLLPRSFVEKGFQDYTRKNNPVMMYVHPWEFNKDQPPRNVSLKQKIIQSPWTYTTDKKLKFLLDRYEFTSIIEYLKEHHEYIAD